MKDNPNINPNQKYNPLPHALWVMVTVLLYFLSTGPFSYLWAHGIISDATAEKILNTIYLPIVWLADGSNLFNGLLNAYLELWS